MFKKLLVCGASLLMMASVGAGASQLAQPAHAHARVSSDYYGYDHTGTLYHGVRINGHYWRKGTKLYGGHGGNAFQLPNGTVPSKYDSWSYMGSPFGPQELVPAWAMRKGHAHYYRSIKRHRTRKPRRSRARKARAKKAVKKHVRKARKATKKNTRKAKKRVVRRVHHAKRARKQVVRQRAVKNSGYQQAIKDANLGGTTATNLVNSKHVLNPSYVKGVLAYSKKHPKTSNQAVTKASITSAKIFYHQGNDFKKGWIDGENSKVDPSLENNMKYKFGWIINDEIRNTGDEGMTNSDYNFAVSNHFYSNTAKRDSILNKLNHGQNGFSMM